MSLYATAEAEDLATADAVLDVDRHGIASELVFAAVLGGKTQRLVEVSNETELYQLELQARTLVDEGRSRQLLYLLQLETARRFTVGSDTAATPGKKHGSGVEAGSAAEPDGRDIATPTEPRDRDLYDYHVSSSSGAAQEAATDHTHTTTTTTTHTAYGGYGYGYGGFYSEAEFEEQRQFLERQYVAKPPQGAPPRPPPQHQHQQQQSDPHASYPVAGTSQHHDYYAALQRGGSAGSSAQRGGSAGSAGPAAAALGGSRLGSARSTASAASSDHYAVFPVPSPPKHLSGDRSLTTPTEGGGGAGGQPPSRHVGAISMDYVDYLYKRHNVHRFQPYGAGVSEAGASAASSTATAISRPTTLPENLQKTMLFAEAASRGGIDVDWYDGWMKLSTLAQQQQWHMYDWSLSGAVRQTALRHKGPAVTCRHLPVAFRPPERPPPRSARPTTAGPASSSLAAAIAAGGGSGASPGGIGIGMLVALPDIHTDERGETSRSVIAAQSVLASPRTRRPPSAAVMVANLKAAVPQSYANRLAGYHH